MGAPVIHLNRASNETTEAQQILEDLPIVPYPHILSSSVKPNGPMTKSPEIQKELGGVIRALYRLSDDRRRSPARQNEVGAVVHAISNGRHAGMCVWMMWINHWRLQTLTPQIHNEYVEQWRAFSNHTVASSGYNGRARLHTMVQQDSNAASFEEYLNAERCHDHTDRMTAGNTTLHLMGSLTHMDLARYIYHRVQNTVSCSSTAGRGLWYQYNAADHRWYFDRL